MPDMEPNLTDALGLLSPFIDNRHIEKSWKVIDLAPPYLLYWLCCVVLWQYMLRPLVKRRLTSHLQTGENT